MRKILKILSVLALSAYIIFCAVMYLLQEKLIFHPDKLESTYHFNFKQDFEEISFQSEDGVKINGVLFKASNPEGAILYLHGNRGSLRDCGHRAPIYTSLKQDIFMIDYRGYGKSEGGIFSEEQFYADVQLAYDKLKERYQENQITIIGYSVGTASAAMLAANNHPRQLILHAPYFSLLDLTERRFPMIPTSMLKYKFQTNQFIGKVEAPITIFHGDKDRVIYYGSSLKLQKMFRPKDRLVTLHGLGHNGFERNEEYLLELAKLF